MPVQVDHREHVAVVALDRPEKRNAMDAEMTTAALDDALNRLDDDPGVRVVVLASSSSVFSAGTDRRTGSGGPTGRGGPPGIARRTHRTPIVAAVEGPALGAGFEIVLSCDLVVASIAASFGLPEVSRGVVATCGGLFRTHRALPFNLATELLLTGDPIDARRAFELGLVNRLTEMGGALREALAWRPGSPGTLPPPSARPCGRSICTPGHRTSSAGSPLTTPGTLCSRRPTPPRASTHSSSVGHPHGRPPDAWSDPVGTGPCPISPRRPRPRSTTSRG